MTLHYETQRLILRTMASDEAHLSLAYYRRNRTLLGPYDPTRDENFYTEDHHRRLLEAEQKEMDALRMIRLWLFLKDEPTADPIGNIAFTNIVRGAFLSTFLSYKSDLNHIRQGYMKEALSRGIQIIFNDYGLHRIEANIMPKNQASLQTVRSLGFTEEGIARKYLRINGIWEDHIHMVLLNDGLETS